MLYCPNCGKKIKSNSRFCPYCGAKQNTNYNDPAPSESTRNSSKYWITTTLEFLAPVVSWIILAFLVISNTGHIQKDIWLNLNRILFIVPFVCLIVNLYMSFRNFKKPLKSRKIISIILGIYSILLLIFLVVENMAALKGGVPLGF